MRRSFTFFTLEPSIAPKGFSQPVRGFCAIEPSGLYFGTVGGVPRVERTTPPLATLALSVTSLERSLETSVEVMIVNQFAAFVVMFTRPFNLLNSDGRIIPV